MNAALTAFACLSLTGFLYVTSGEAVRVGKNVTHVKVGDTVGVGKSHDEKGKADDIELRLLFTHRRSMRQLLDLPSVQGPP